MDYDPLRYVPQAYENRKLLLKILMEKEPEFKRTMEEYQVVMHTFQTCGFSEHRSRLAKQGERLELKISGRVSCVTSPFCD